jgi:hypothetical protein
MPEESYHAFCGSPAYGVYAWEGEEATNTLRLRIRQTAPEPYYVRGGCGISVRAVHSWDRAAAPGSALGYLAGLAGGGSAPGALSPLAGADRAAAICDRQGARHDAAGGGGGPRL